MGDHALAAASALWLGILTSISPCPLATNIAAVSFLGRRVDSPRMVIGGGLLYAFGRTIAYVVLGALLLAGLMSAPGVSIFLQRNMNRIVGPLLIVVGLFLLELFRVRLPGPGRSGEGLGAKLAARGMWGAAPLGALFALSFCPVSAALFFGSLVPLALEMRSPVLLPTFYGVGTALPVALFAILVAVGARGVGLAFDRLTLVERWARRALAVIFIGVGIYMTLSFTLGLPL
jgi:threonine/homoserine/homoserine lactone efflux protein